MKITQLICITTVSMLTLTACHDSAAVQKLIQQSRNNMVYVPGGTYMMRPSDPRLQVGNNYPPHKVTLTSFFISKDNVSCGDYDTYTEASSLI